MKFKKILKKIIKNIYFQNILLVFTGIISWIIILSFLFENLNSIANMNLRTFEQLTDNYYNILVAIYESKNPEILKKTMKVNSIFIIDKNGKIKESYPSDILKGISIKSSDFFKNIKSIGENKTILRYPSLTDGGMNVHFLARYKEDYMIAEIKEDIFAKNFRDASITIQNKTGTLLYTTISDIKILPSEMPFFSRNFYHFYLTKKSEFNNLNVYTTININKVLFIIGCFTIVIIVLVWQNGRSRSRTLKSLNHFSNEFDEINKSLVLLRNKLRIMEKTESDKIIELDFDEVLNSIENADFKHDEIKELKEVINLTVKDLAQLVSELSESYEEITNSNIELESLYNEVEKTYNQLEQSYRNFAKRLSVIAEKYDDITGSHIDRVSEYSKFIAVKMGMPKNFCENIAYYAPLHDIGKLLVKREILDKPGKLTIGEYEEMKQHCIYGGQILQDDEKFEFARNISLYHHEKYDGSGYPFKLSGEQIPIEARIVALADVYDALRSSRPYKDGFTHEEAVEIIINGDFRTKPDHFDPKIIDIFKEYNEEFKIIFDGYKK